jgi:fatty acid desaturase
MRWLSIYWDMDRFPVLMFVGLVAFVIAYNYAALKIGSSRPEIGRWMFALIHALGFAFVPTWILGWFIQSVYAIWLFPLLYPFGIYVSLREQRRKSMKKAA